MYLTGFKYHSIYTYIQNIYNSICYVFIKNAFNFKKIKQINIIFTSLSLLVARGDLFKCSNEEIKGLARKKKHNTYAKHIQLLKPSSNELCIAISQSEFSHLNTWT